VLLSVVPSQPNNYAYVPQHDENAPDQPPAAAGHDPMAELIRKNEQANSVPKSAKEPAKEDVSEPVQQKSAARAAKTYGARDRQALDRLVQTGGDR
jgi:hypothetical protein